jgi:PAS domain S-box-containing protein
MDVRGVGFRILFVALIVSSADSTAGGIEPRRILLLHSFGRDLTPLDMVAMNFPAEFDRRWGGPTSFYDLTLQPASFGQPPQEKPVVDYLASLVSGRQVDMVVTIGGPAALFAQKYRQQLFPSVPVVFAAVDYRHLQNSVLSDNETVVSVRNEPTSIIDNIRQILPETRTIYVIVGNSNLERFWKDDMADEFQRFEGRLQFVWLNDLSYTELLARCASLPPHSAIFFVNFAVDGNGVSFTEARVLSELHASANAPIFGQHSTQVGRGAVGGPVMSIDLVTKNAADAAVRILRGESPAGIRMPPQPPGPPIYDWRELQRWNINETRIPPGSTVRFRQPTAWEQYKWTIVVGLAVFILEAGLIVALLVNRTRRRRAERSLRENRNRLGAVLETATEGIITINQHGFIESVNPAAEKIFGYASADMVGRSADMLTANSNAFAPTAINSSCELSARRKDGSIFPIDLTVSEMFIDDHRVRTAFVRDISERKQAEQMAHEFGGRLLQAQEAERARLARELHDDITQRLAQLAIQTGRLNSRPDPTAQHETVREVLEGLRHLSEDVHSLAYNLHPAFLEHLDLPEALQAECERFSRQESIAVSVILEDVPSIPQDVKLCLFRVAQEALNNVRRHAQAKTAEVSLGRSDNGLKLTVSDSGAGFDLGDVARRPSLGLASMEERVRLVQGKLEIQSNPGQGTILSAWIPLREEAAPRVAFTPGSAEPSRKAANTAIARGQQK